jgi:hypothetical protein
MSKVFSFRLREDNPREVQAKEVIETWASQEYSLRHILTEALIRYGDNEHNRVEVDDLLEQFRGLLLKSTNGQILDKAVGNDEIPLPHNFIASIKNGVKPGIRVDQGDIRI